jgi:hypothetical protein
MTLFVLLLSVIARFVLLRNRTGSN